MDRGKTTEDIEEGDLEEEQEAPLSLRTEDMKQGTFKEEAALWRAHFQKEIDERDRIEQERVQMIREAREEKEQALELERYQETMKRNAKPYFTFKQGRYGLVKESTHVNYFGENVVIGEGKYPGQSIPFWFPQGTGDLSVRGSTLYEGSFLHGQMHGEGNFDFQNGDSYKGSFRFDLMHGKGKAILTEESRIRLVENPDLTAIATEEEEEEEGKEGEGKQQDGDPHNSSSSSSQREGNNLLSSLGLDQGSNSHQNRGFGASMGSKGRGKGREEEEGIWWEGTRVCWLRELDPGVRIQLFPDQIEKKRDMTLMRKCEGCQGETWQIKDESSGIFERIDLSKTPFRIRREAPHVMHLELLEFVLSFYFTLFLSIYLL